MKVVSAVTAALGISLLSSLSGAQAAMNVDSFRNSIDDPTNRMLVEYYVAAVYEGLDTVEGQLSYAGSPRHFCVPGSIPLQSATLVNLIADELARGTDGNYGSDQPISAILLNSLVTTFPCR